MSDSSFRLGYVPGVTPAKWARIWAERLPRTPIELIQVGAADAVGLIHDGGADAALVRLPIDRTGLHAIPLYVEQTVVVVPKEHVVTAVEEVALEDLADELMLHPQDDVLDVGAAVAGPGDRRAAGDDRDAIALVAMGTGLLIVPMSLARLHHRKDLTFRPLLEAPASQVALAWPEGAESGLVEEFVGIVRGRTANSTRGSRPEPEAQEGRAQEATAEPAAEEEKRGAEGTDPEAQVPPPLVSVEPSTIVGIWQSSGSTTRCCTCATWPRASRSTAMSWASTTSTAATRIPGAAFLRAPDSTNDHDLGLFQIGAEAGPSGAGRSDGRAVPPGLGGRHPRRSARSWPAPGRAGALVGASDHGTTKSLYGKDPDGLEFEIVWIIPADLLTDEDREHAGITRLDLDAEIAKYGRDARSGVGISR